MRFVDILVGTGCLFGKDHSTRLDPKGDTYDFFHLPMHSNNLKDIKSLAFCQKTFHGSRKSLGKGVKLKPKAARAASEISTAQSVLFSSPAYLAYILHISCILFTNWPWSILKCPHRSWSMWCNRSNMVQLDFFWIWQILSRSLGPQLSPQLARGDSLQLGVGEAECPNPAGFEGGTVWHCHICHICHGILIVGIPRPRALGQYHSTLTVIPPSNRSNISFIPRFCTMSVFTSHWRIEKQDSKGPPQSLPLKPCRVADTGNSEVHALANVQLMSAVALLPTTYLVHIFWTKVSDIAVHFHGSNFDGLDVHTHTCSTSSGPSRWGRLYSSSSFLITDTNMISESFLWRSQCTATSSVSATAEGSAQVHACAADASAHECQYLKDVTWMRHGDMTVDGFVCTCWHETNKYPVKHTGIVMFNGFQPDQCICWKIFNNHGQGTTCPWSDCPSCSLELPICREPEDSVRICKLLQI